MRSACFKTLDRIDEPGLASLQHILQHMLLHATPLQLLRVVRPNISTAGVHKSSRRSAHRRVCVLVYLSMAPKRKQDQTEPDADEEVVKKPRAKAAKKKVSTEPYTTEDGWTVVPPSLLFK